MPKNLFASRNAPRRQASLQEVSPLFSAFSLNFWPLGASSAVVTPIFGYAYKRLSNNKQ